MPANTFKSRSGGALFGPPAAMSNASPELCKLPLPFPSGGAGSATAGALSLPAFQSSYSRFCLS